MTGKVELGRALQSRQRLETAVSVHTTGFTAVVNSGFGLGVLADSRAGGSVVPAGDSLHEDINRVGTQLGEHWKGKKSPGAGKQMSMDS